jgi:hypothetical protein
VKPEDPLRGITLVTLTCSVDESEDLKNKIVFEMKRLAQEGPTPMELRNCIAADKQERETAQKTNSFWLQALSTQYSSPRYSPPAKNVEDAFQEMESARDELYRSMDAEQMRDCFAAIYDGLQFERRTEVTLMPLPTWRRILKWTAATAAAAAAVGMITLVVARRRTIR